jgi:signal transduction histidine kinase
MNSEETPQTSSIIRADITPRRLLFLSLISIFLAEMIITFFVFDIFDLQIFDQAVFDIFFTTLLVYPTLYIFLFRPITKAMNERNEAIRTLQIEQAGLNQKVKDRTATLAQAYESELHARKLAETMRMASLAITQSMKLDVVIKNLFDYMFLLIPYDRAGLLFLDEDRHCVLPAIWDNRSNLPPSPSLASEVDFGSFDMIQSMLSNQQSVLISDTRSHPGSDLWPDHADVRSWLGVPLTVRGELIGLLFLENMTPGYFQKEHKNLAEPLAAEAATVIQNVQLFQKLGINHGKLQLLSRRLAETQEDERRNISRELHDGLGQALTSVMVKLNVIEQRVTMPDAAIKEFGELYQLLENALEDTHQIAMGLHPVSLDQLGLVAALRQYLKLVVDMNTLGISFTPVGDIGRLPYEIEISLFRITQEAITNVIRHAKAQRVDVLLEKRDGRMVLIIEDDGVGFDKSKVPPGERLGLFGMHERVEMLGGTLSIESQTGEGTALLVEIPYDNQSVNS